MRRAPGLRNRLVHAYNGLDDATALAAMARLAPAIRAFLEGVERWWAAKR